MSTIGALQFWKDFNIHEFQVFFKQMMHKMLIHDTVRIWQARFEIKFIAQLLQQACTALVSVVRQTKKNKCYQQSQVKQGVGLSNRDMRGVIKSDISGHVGGIQPMQFDLHGSNILVNSMQRFLDSQATDIAQRQDESNQSRKKLVELSRDFKKSSSEVML